MNLLSFYRAFKHLFKMGLLDSLQFRSRFISFLLGPFISIGILYFVWHTIYLQSPNITANNLSLNELIIYYTVTIFISSISLNNISDWISNIVRSGYLLKFTIRNISPFMYFIAYSYGSMIIKRLIILIIVILLVFTLSVKVSIINLIIAVWFLILGISIDFLIYSIISLLSVRLKRIDGIVASYSLLVGMLDGSLLPLSFYPTYFQNISYFLPFQYLNYFPIMILFNKITYSNLIIGFVVSILWFVILYLLLNYLYPIAVKYFEAEGG